MGSTARTGSQGRRRHDEPSTTTAAQLIPIPIHAYIPFSVLIRLSVCQRSPLLPGRRSIARRRRAASLDLGRFLAHAGLWLGHHVPLTRACTWVGPAGRMDPIIRFRSAAGPDDYNYAQV